MLKTWLAGSREAKEEAGVNELDPSRPVPEYPLPRRRPGAADLDVFVPDRPTGGRHRPLPWSARVVIDARTGRPRLRYALACA
jgi:hypothetical protein